MIYTSDSQPMVRVQPAVRRTFPGDIRAKPNIHAYVYQNY